MTRVTPDPFDQSASPDTVAIRWLGHAVQLLDQRRLPQEEHWLTIEGAAGVSQAIRDMAVAGLGVAMLPGFIARRAVEEGQLVELLSHAESRRLPIMAVWPPVSPMPVKLRLIIDFLVAELAGGLSESKRP